MSITVDSSAFVVSGGQTINLSSMLNVTADAGNPAYLIVSGLDRNEYPAGATGATGTLNGNGATATFSGIGADGRGVGVVFTYQAASGRYYNSTFGYLDQATYTASGSLDDVTSLSFFGTSFLPLGTAFGQYSTMLLQSSLATYMGSVTVATQPGFTGPVPIQATPNSISAVAESFVGKAWNMDGCWVLANTIAAEAGASLSVASTNVGTPGFANGEWIVAYNGPAGASGNWQSMVQAGEMVVFQTSDTSGHITTCVSGSGSSAMVVDNVTYVDGGGAILNPANDGSANDVLVAAPHLASQEFSGISASSVVIYELDTPVVSDLVATDTLAVTAKQFLSAVFAAADPAGKAVTAYQVYDTATTDSLIVNGTTVSAHTAATAATATSLASVCLVAGSTACTDTVEVRAFNGTYWGDWQSVSVSVTGAAPTPIPPELAIQTGNQTWTQGHVLSFGLTAGTFVDPNGEALTYSATLSNGKALPSWIIFNAATESFIGKVPAGTQSFGLTVTATDTSGLTATDTFAVNVPAVAPVVAHATPNQTWTTGQQVSLALPSNTFVDPQGEALTYTAYQVSGKSVTSWLSFNAHTDTFSGTVPSSASGTIMLEVVARDTSGLIATDMFDVTFAAPPAAGSPTASSVALMGVSHTTPTELIHF